MAKKAQTTAPQDEQPREDSPEVTEALSLLVNKKLWMQLKEVPKDARTSFDRGGFKGTAINPTWQMQRMTEIFGPVGMGWGVDHVEHKLVPAGDELLVFCTVRAWYCPGGEERCILHGFGGDKVTAVRGRGDKAYTHNDDEAFKKAYTDALGNCFKSLGLGAAIHMGEYDGKYRQPTDDEKPPKDAKKAAPAQEERPVTSADEVSKILRGLDTIKMEGTPIDLKEYWMSKANLIADATEEDRKNITVKKDQIKAMFAKREQDIKDAAARKAVRGQPLDDEIPY
jgi:hypothetical protein